MYIVNAWPGTSWCFTLWMDRIYEFRSQNGKCPGEKFDHGLKHYIFGWFMKNRGIWLIQLRTSQDHSTVQILVGTCHFVTFSCKTILTIVIPWMSMKTHWKISWMGVCKIMESNSCDIHHLKGLEKLCWSNSCHTERFSWQPRTGTCEDICTWHREQLKSRTPSPLTYVGQPLVSVVLAFRAFFPRI